MEYEQQDTSLSYAVEDDDTPILPDGYGEGDDIFSPESWTGGTADASAADDGSTDAEGDTAGEPETTPDGSGDGETGDGQTGEETAADGTTPTTGEQTAQEPTPEAKTPAKLKFTARIDHSDRDVELDEKDLPNIYQRAQNHDKLQERLERYERLSKATGFDGLEAMMNAAEEKFRESEIERLSNDPEALAKYLVDFRMGRTDAAGRQTAEQPKETAPAKSARDTNAEARELLSARPDLMGKSLPPEVFAIANSGKSLLQSYLEYEGKQKSAEIAKVQKENSILKQNAAASVRAPVTGVSKGGKTDTSPKDPFLEGLMSDDW